MSEIGQRAVSKLSYEMRMWNIVAVLSLVLVGVLSAVATFQAWWFRGVEPWEMRSFSQFGEVLNGLNYGDEIIIFATLGNKRLEKRVVVSSHRGRIIVEPEGREGLKNMIFCDSQRERIVFFHQVLEIRRGGKVLWRRNPPPIFV